MKASSRTLIKNNKTYILTKKKKFTSKKNCNVDLGMNMNACVWNQTI